MKKSYSRPALLEYGRLEHLTLGTGGTLPDFLGNQLVNNTCETQTFLQNGQVISRTSCINEPPDPVGS
jgi:hypothetical protein